MHILVSSSSTVLIRASTLNGTAKLQLQDSLGRDNFIAAEGADNLVFAADEGNAGADSHMRFKVDGDEYPISTRDPLSKFKCKSLCPVVGWTVK